MGSVERLDAPRIYEPQQDRSRESFAKVRASVVRLLHERGANGFTLADVSAQSGVSVGSIYGRVGNKASLLFAVQDEEYSRIDSSVEARLLAGAEAGHTFEASVMSVIAARLDLLREEAPIVRAFISLGDENPEIAKRGIQSAELGERSFIEALERACSRFKMKVPAHSIRWCEEVVYSIIARQLGFGLGTQGLPAVFFPKSELVSDLSQTVCLFLLASAEQI